MKLTISSFMILLRFFFRNSFNLWRSLLIITIYSQTKIPIGFWYMWKLNPQSLIQLSEILPIKLTRTHFLRKILVPQYSHNNLLYTTNYY